MKYLATFLLALVAAALAGAFYLYSGAFNVAATASEGALANRVVRTAMERAVRTRADDEAAPARFTEAQVRAGFAEYDAECVQCHGAPGVEPAEWAKGMRPPPPDLARAAPRWSAAELHWIVRNGIAMTGMPAMGSHHSDHDLWSIVAFVQTLPKHTPAAYRGMREEAGAMAHEQAPHSH